MDRTKIHGQGTIKYVELLFRLVLAVEGKDCLLACVLGTGTMTKATREVRSDKRRLPIKFSLLTILYMFNINSIFTISECGIQPS